jgi:hypothetical protein
MQKNILICGFPHCGTTILKSIIGHCQNVKEIYNETETIQNIKTEKEFILCKYPFTRTKYFNSTSYKDYIKIMIIRNPLFVFSSLNKRYRYRIPSNHSIDNYINTIKLFNQYRETNNNQNNIVTIATNTSLIYTIKYEELFDNNYHNIKKILYDIGVNYTDDIFNNDNYKNISHLRIDIDNIKTKPYDTNHEQYRTWQINQEFKCNNDINKLDLKTEQVKKIINNEHILKLYPNIKTMTL